MIPTARNAHAIITDKNNRFAFVPHLGTDQVFLFAFDAKTGRLTAEHAAGACSSRPAPGRAT